jgi:HEAT repeat protein
MIGALLLNFNLASAKIAPAPSVQTKMTVDLLNEFRKPIKKPEDLKKLKEQTLSMSGKSVPALIEVMKRSDFPDNNRWVATFLLGQIAGTKAGPFLARYTEHPNWVLRMASLKTLLSLKEKKYGKLYARALRDESLLVRTQALDNVSTLNLREHGANVWGMLYDKKNYHQTKKGSNKRGSIIHTVVKTIGDLQFEKAKKPLLSMIKNKKYDDIFTEMDYSLSKITGKDSPKGTKEVKRNYWARMGMSDATIL